MAILTVIFISHVHEIDVSATSCQHDTYIQIQINMLLLIGRPRILQYDDFVVQKRTKGTKVLTDDKLNPLGCHTDL